MLRAGADKVGINTAAVLRPELLPSARDRFGTQCIVLVRRRRAARRAAAERLRGDHPRRTAAAPGIDAVEWAERGAELGAGEILLNSMDADGTTAGYDLRDDRARCAAVVDVPVIATGGAGAVADFAPAVDAGADAVLAASVFHFGELRIGR